MIVEPWTALWEILTLKIHFQMLIKGGYVTSLLMTVWLTLKALSFYKILTSQVILLRETLTLEAT